MIYFSLSKLTMFQYVRSYLIWPSETGHKAPKTQDSVSSSLPEVPTPIAEYVVPEDPPMGLAVPANPPPPPRGDIRLTDFVNEDYLEENPYADVPENDSDVQMFVQMLCVKQGDNTNANNSPVQKQPEATAQPQSRFFIGGMVSVCTTMITARSTTTIESSNSAENMDTDDWIFLDKPFINSQRP